MQISVRIFKQKIKHLSAANKILGYLEEAEIKPDGEYGLSEEDWYRIEAAIVNGATHEEIAHSLNLSVLNFDRAIGRYPSGRWRYNEARKRVENESTANLKRLADGYTVIEREYVAKSGDHVMIAMYQKELIEALRHEDYDEFWRLIMRTAISQDAYDVKVKERVMPPDRLANLSIMKALNPDQWDEELRRKKTPEVKFVVSVSGKDVEKLKPPKQKIEASYEIL